MPYVHYKNKSNKLVAFSSSGKRFPSGLVHEFRGKKVPYITMYSLGGRINQEILIEDLKKIESINLFYRSITKPKIVLDSHIS